MDLYIDGTRADILRTSFAVNWKWYDITSILKRYTVASTNMRLPFSTNNNNIFGYTNVSGSDLTPVWNEKMAKIYFGNYLALSGLLKTKSIGITDKNFQSSIRGDNAIISALNTKTPREIFTSHATANLPSSWTTLQSAVDNLFDGSSYGWMLPLVDDGSNLVVNTGTSHNYFLVNNGLRYHDLWLNVADFLIEAFSLAGITLKIVESGTEKAFTSSNVYAVMREEYMPAFHIGLKRVPSTSNVSWGTTTDRSFVLNTAQTILNADLVISGGNTTWDMIKLISNHYNLGIYLDQQVDQLIMYDIDQSVSSSADWTDKVSKVVKSPVISGYDKVNYLRYKPTDNLDETFAQITLNNNTGIEFLEEEKILEEIKIGIGGIYDLYDTTNVLKFSNIFRVDYFTNKDLYKYPIFLSRANLETVQTITPVIIDSGVLNSSKNMYKMAFLDTSSYFSWIEDYALDVNEFYSCKIKLNLSDLTDLKPWDVITIKDLGSKMYVNQIKSFNGERPTTVELVKLA